VKQLALVLAIVAVAVTASACSPQAQQKIQEGLQTAAPTIKAAAETKVSAGLQTAAPTIAAVGTQVVQGVAQVGTQVAAGVQTAAPTVLAATTEIAGAAAGVQGAMEKAVALATAWSWQSSTMSDGTKQQPTDPSKYSLDFRLDQTVNITADCNQVAGTYATKDGTLTIGLGASTLAACPEGSMADEFLKELGEVSGAKMDGQNLILTLKNDSGSMTFAPLQ
jgi:heat shock protein HslJ